MKKWILFLLLISNVAFGGFFSSDIDSQNIDTVNIIKNAGAENGKSAWTNTGSGTFSTTVSNPIDGTTSFVWNPAAAADKLTSDGVRIPGKIEGVLCLGEIYYRGAGGADITLRVEDADGDEIKSVVISDAQTSNKRAFIEPICPSSTATVNDRTLNIELEAAGDANAITFDATWLGTKSLTRGAAITSESLTSPTLQNGTGLSASVNELIYTREGENFEGTWTLDTISGTGTDANPIFFVLPSSLTATINNVGVGSFRVIGNGRVNVTGSSEEVTVDLVNNSGSPLLRIIQSDGTVLNGNEVGAGDSISINYSIRVSEWIGSGTVNLLNNSTLNSNSKIRISGFSNTAIGSGTQSLEFDVEDYSIGITSNAGSGATIATVPSDGYYKIRAQIAWSGAPTTLVDLRIVEGASTIKTINNYAANTAQNMVVEDTIFLTKGQTIKIQKDSSGALTGINDSSRTFFTIERVADVSSEQAFGFGIADSINAGLTSKEFESEYAPTSSSATNVTVVGTRNAEFSQQGNRVTVSGNIRVSITGAGNASFRIDLPIPPNANFTGVDQGNGSGSMDNGANPFLSWAIEPVTGTSLVQFTTYASVASTNTDIRFIFQYSLD